MMRKPLIEALSLSFERHDYSGSKSWRRGQNVSESTIE